MKSKIMTFLLIAILITSVWQAFAFAQMQETIVLAISQTPVNYGRIVRGSPNERVLVANQITILEKDKTSLGWDVTWATAQPVGYHVPTESGVRVPKQDWIDWANIEIADLQAKIDVLNAM